ncbi:MAG: hypothetical protein HC822_04420 [Oscillochloris sp.]|nr:hypothetical protein [Oscillochloris sp.]
MSVDRNVERAVLWYWIGSFAIGMPLLFDWIFAWNVAATVSRPALVLLLLATFAATQGLYVIVAHHGDRPIHWPATIIFALGNGFFETLAFASVYRIGEIIGHAVVALVAPNAASVAGFLLGMFFFTIYGGLIHGLFWLRKLPPHLNDSPRSKAIRRIRPIFEVALVFGWSLVFWLNRDFWTVTAIHIMVDVGLMLQVRPPLFISSKF